MEDNQTNDGHYRLYTYPTPRKLPPAPNNQIQKLSILGINNFQGEFLPKTFSIKNRFGENRLLSIGGSSAVKSYLDIFKSKFNHPISLVSTGSFLSTNKKHQEEIYHLNTIGIDAAAIGGNELGLQYNKSTYLNYLGNIIKKSKFPVLNNNLIYLLSENEVNDIGVKPYYIKEIRGVKFGYIGSLAQSDSKVIPEKNVPGLHIEHAAKNIIMSANSLRKQGAEVVVLIFSQGIDCTSLLSQELNLPAEKVNFYPHENKYCNNFKNELSQTLKLLPPNLVDVVFTSGMDTKVANFIEGIPVLQNWGNGQYLSWVDLYFDKKHNQIDRSKTVIHQPIQLCHQFFKDTEDCFTKEDFFNKELMSAMFLGEKIKVDPPRK